MNPAAAECAHTGDDGQRAEAEARHCRVCEGSCRAAWLCLLLHGLSSAEYEACVALTHGPPTGLASAGAGAGASGMTRGPWSSPLFWGGVFVVLAIAAVAARHVSRGASPRARRQAEWLAASSCSEGTLYTAMPG
jgi:hypothetical protein